MNISKLKRIKSKTLYLYDYCRVGVWTDMRNNWWVRLIKTLNLSISAFFNGDIQTKACALTYRSMLAIVPALALLFAIGRGFGLQEVLQNELIDSFGSQKELLQRAFLFVDSYLAQSSKGIFVGIGIVFLLWTLISILSAVERAFNDIWGVKNGRSIWRKVTDYMAIFFILPVLMICAGGLSVFVSETVRTIFPMADVSPLVTFLLDFATLVLIWFFFAGVYMLIPNTKVKFKNAIVAGIFAGTVFMILQWLFVSGQVYVSKYNAIYGSVAFLPLLLIWLQLTWVVCLAGGVVCYASQNVFHFNFSTEISRISSDYRLKIMIAIAAAVVDEYLKQQQSPTQEDIVNRYGLPPRLVATSINRLVDAGVLLRVVRNPKEDVYGYAPALDASTMTLGQVMAILKHYGSQDFIPDFDSRFARVIEAVDAAEQTMTATQASILIKDIAPTHDEKR